MKKNRIISFFAAAVLIIGLLPIGAAAAVEGIYTYQIDGGRAVIKSAAASASGRVSVPEKLGGVPVAEIASGAFSQCRGVAKINIPSSVEKIADNAFAGCAALEGIYTDGENENFRSEGGVLFNSDMTELVCYPAGKSGQSYVIPQNVKKIGAYAFFGASELQYIDMASAEKIGEFAFSRCGGLKMASIAQTVGKIGEFAFARCSQLEAVLMNSDSLSAGNYAFAYCGQLERAEIFCDSAEFGAFVFKDSANAVVYGFDGSDAHKYAELNNIKFTAVSGGGFVPASGISLDKSQISLTAGQSAELNAKIAPADAASAAVVWISDKPDAVSVRNGRITAKTGGSAVITAISVDGLFTAQCRVSGGTQQPTTQKTTAAPSGGGGGGGGGGSSEPTSATGEQKTTAQPTQTQKPDDSGNVEAQSGYIKGYSDGSFRPDEKITRAEAAVIFARISADFDGQKDYAGGFADVNKNHWFAAAVGFAARKGIVNGGADGSFRPNDSITRAEFSAMAARFCGLDAGSGSAGFDDCNGHWARGYIAAMSQKGGIGGYSDGTFRPDNTITRAEAVKIVNSVLGKQPQPAAEAKFSDVNKDHWAFGHIAAATAD